jgi:ubiquitin-conjugating enzyme E2 N
MSAKAPARIVKEYERWKKDPADGISFTVDKNNIRYLTVLVQGPVGSPYEGGLFKIEMFLPEGYPMSPPKARFLTKIYQ